MTVSIDNAQFEFINCYGCYFVYVRISDILYEGMMKKKMPLITVKDENGVIFARTTIVPSEVDRFKGTYIMFSVKELLGTDGYVLRPLAYKRKYEGIIHNERRLDDEYYDTLKSVRVANELNKKYYKALKAVREYERRNSMFGINNVIHHDPATIVYWCDGTKTVVKCGENDIYDPEKGLAMAISKKVFGNEGNYYNQFKKWLPKEETNTSDDPTDEPAEYVKKSDVITNKNPIESENTWGF